MLDDPDGDRIPNIFEYANGETLPKVASSIPTVHITVDPVTITEISALKKTIQSAIVDSLNSNRHTIIRVKPGTYPESIRIYGRWILLLGDLGAALPVIAPPDGPAVRIEQGRVVLDGFSMAGPPTANTNYSLMIAPDSANDQVKLINCSIYGFTPGDRFAAYLNNGRLTIVHCNVVNNSLKAGGKVFSLQPSARLSLVNSIVWNPTDTTAQQIYQSVLGTASVTNCIIFGGELGGISTPPKLDRYGCLLPTSSALGAGASLPASSLDRHGELRPAVAPDIGADQRLDSDSDSLPDWWEKAYFGNLAKVAADDSDTPTLDRLTNYNEYLLGLDPTKPDSLGNGNGDLFNAVFGSINDSWYPSEWRLDSDGDGLTNGQELYYQSSPANPDTNGDGLSDLVAVFAGLSATSNDTDGDGIANSVELLNGTNPFLADTDCDGVNDNLDPLPLDPSVWSLPAPLPSDVTAPIITLQKPSGAVLQP